MAQIKRCACGHRATITVVSKDTSGQALAVVKCEPCAIAQSEVLQREGYLVEWWEL